MTRYRHKKRGTVYTEIGRAELQMASELVDGAELVVYRGDDGKLWAREVSEFLDGRFEELPAETPPCTQSPARPSAADIAAAVDVLNQKKRNLAQEAAGYRATSLSRAQSEMPMEADYYLRVAANIESRAAALARVVEWLEAFSND